MEAQVTERNEVKREAEKARVGTTNLESDSALRRRETKRHGKLANAVRRRKSGPSVILLQLPNPDDDAMSPRRVIRSIAAAKVTPVSRRQRAKGDKAGGRAQRLRRTQAGRINTMRDGEIRGCIPARLRHTVKWKETGLWCPLINKLVNLLSS